MHLDDLCAADPVLKTRIDTILNEKIYPLVRATIGQESDNHIPPQGSLCVYDSILVRYNGEKARAAGRVGASQPLVSWSFGVMPHLNRILFSHNEPYLYHLPYIASRWRHLLCQHCP